MAEEFLTQFQKRKLDAVAAAMNERVRELAPKILLHEVIFEAGIKGGDGSLYAVMPNCAARGVDPDIINGILRVFDPKIQLALKHRNPFKDLAAIVTSIIIWETPNAFLVNESNPHTLKNQTKSPIYADNAIMNTWPPFMNTISAFAQIELEMAMRKCDVIIGGESRGIPFATWIAKDLAKGTGIARKEIKTHGTKKGVEGGILPGEVAVLVEDLTTDGGSKEPFVKNIRNMGAEIKDVLVVFDRKQGAEKFLREKLGVELHSLTDIDVHLKVGLERGYITPEEEQSIQEYLKDPKAWNIGRNYGWPISG
ncbi:MAG: phosphoribosyltransferase family protein [bacterium]|nr:phosphoribosyltransferase family protein [bacterium]